MKKREKWKYWMMISNDDKREIELMNINSGENDDIEWWYRMKKREKWKYWISILVKMMISNDDKREMEILNVYSGEKREKWK